MKLHRSCGIVPVCMLVALIAMNQRAVGQSEISVGDHCSIGDANSNRHPPRPGELINVDLVFRNLGNKVAPALRAFELEIGFDARAVSPRSVAFGRSLGNPDSPDETETFFAFSPSTVDLWENSLLSTPDLDSLQTDCFPLASITFEALAGGASLLTVDSVVGLDAFGELLEIKTKSGVAVVRGGTPRFIGIPEPSSLLLLIFVSLIASMIRMKPAR